MSTQLPNLMGYLIPFAIILAIVVLIGFGVMLRWAQAFRSGLAQELKRELAAAREASPVSVQQPLQVQEHTSAATVAQLEAVKIEAHGRMKRERAEVDAQILGVKQAAEARIQRVDEIAERRSDKIEAKIDENTKLTATMSGQVAQMNQQLHQLTASVTGFISRQAQS